MTPMTKSLVIFGVGSVARLAHYYATHEMGLSVLGFAVDRSRKSIDRFCDLPVFVWEEFTEMHPPEMTACFAAVGYREMRSRQTVFERIQSHGYDLENIVSTSAFVAKTSSCGINNFLMPGVVVEPGVRLGSNNLIWSNATICHDSHIGSHNFFASNCTVGGEVGIGDRCFFGFSSTVIHQRHVGDDVLLGAQSLLLCNADSLGRYQGVPAVKVLELDAATGVRVN
jgi:sugar O-acyltransferase (sialic acid O-acetyltransferase NeuD family)